jgi:hypothetical protein
MNKEQQKQLITEIMDLDAKDGLYEDDIEKFQQDAWDNYEHVDGNLYSTTFRNAFKLGYNKAKETLYTEQEIRKAYFRGNNIDYLIQVLKQLKKN